MKKIFLFLTLISYLLILSKKASAIDKKDSLQSNFEIFFSYNIFLTPKPFVFLIAGENIMNLQRNFGNEYGIGGSYIFKNNFGIKLWYSSGTTQRELNTYDDFFIKTMKTKNVLIDKNKLENVKSWEKPFAINNTQLFNTLSFNLFYRKQINSRLGINFENGIRFIKFVPASFKSNLTKFNTIDLGDEFFRGETATNMDPLEYKPFDICYNISAGIYWTIYHYNTISLSFYFTSVKRYVHYIEYSSITTLGTYKGKIIQPVSMFGIKAAYSFNFGGITHFSKYR